MPKNKPIDSSNDDFLTFIYNFLHKGKRTDREFKATPIDADGSQRIFMRIAYSFGQSSIIAVKNPPLTPFARRENTAYLKIGKHLLATGAPVPQIHQWDLENGWFLMEDFGDQKLQEAALKSSDPVSLYSQVLEVLLQIQTKGANGFDTGWCCQTAYYDQYTMRRFESDYFRDSFLCSYLESDSKWDELEEPFDYLAQKASRAEKSFFLHRDFQSRNIMVTGDRIGIVDWQGGRMGALGYDVASLLIDPYSSLSMDERKQLKKTYQDMLMDSIPEQVSLFEDTYPYIAIQRNLQILGAFSFLSLKKGKPFFKAFIPPSLNSLLGLLHDLGDPKLRILENILKTIPRPWERNR